MQQTTREIVRAAVIAAAYAILTVALAPISSGLVQCRVSEALCVLPYFSVSAVPGLFLGCLIANIATGAPALDVVFGSLATLIAALGTYSIKVMSLPKYLSPLPAVLANALIVGCLLKYAYGMNVPFTLSALYVGLGEAVACFGLGLPLLAALERHGGKLFD